MDSKSESLKLTRAAGCLRSVAGETPVKGSNSPSGAAAEYPLSMLRKETKTHVTLRVDDRLHLPFYFEVTVEKKALALVSVTGMLVCVPAKGGPRRDGVTKYPMKPTFEFNGATKMAEFRDSANPWCYARFALDT